jgi:hypothetical protein
MPLHGRATSLRENRRCRRSNLDARIAFDTLNASHTDATHDGAPVADPRSSPPRTCAGEIAASTVVTSRRRRVSPVAALASEVGLQLRVRRRRGDVARRALRA